MAIQNLDRFSSKKVVILGAGSSGLSVAWGLAGKKGYDVSILESSLEVGGFSKTIDHNGIRFDIGPHRLSPQLPEIIDKIRTLLDDDLLLIENLHGVYFNRMIFSYPPRFSDLFKKKALKIVMEFTTSWVSARLAATFNKWLGKSRTSTFNSLLISAFGKNICKEVIFPMIAKVWGTTDLHSDFARIRFEIPTFTNTCRRLFSQNRKSYYYYPSRGFGTIFNTLHKFLLEKGCTLELGTHVIRIKAQSLNGPFDVIYSLNGSEKTIRADILVSSISNKQLVTYFSETGLVDPLLPEVTAFISRTMWLGILHVENCDLPDRIVIFPESKYIFNRISKMYSSQARSDNSAILMVDVICDAGSKFDLMDEVTFNSMLLDSVLSLGWFKREDIRKSFSLRFPNAYPVLNKARYNAQDRIDNFFKDSAVILCGREASSDYNNAHNAIEKGLLTARYINGEIHPEEYIKSAKIIGRLPIQD